MNSGRNDALLPLNEPAAASRTSDILHLASIIIPTLNEEDHIAPLLDQLLAQAPAGITEILIADGGSTDRTRSIVHRYAERDRRVRLIDNPGRIQAAGVNIGARACDPKSEILIRIDAHARYDASFLPTLLTEMQAPERDSIVVRMRTEGTTCFQRAVAIVSNSGVGTGGSAHRVGSGSHYVDHGHHAAFRRKTFLELGGYDESFRTNEDAEFDYRLTARGGRIWLAGNAEIRYFPRSTPAGLARQYFRYGSGRAQNLIKHGTMPKSRQLVPVLLTLYLVAGLPLAFLISPIFAIPALAYLALLIGVTASALLSHRSACAFGVGIALPLMHVGWGLGFLTKTLFGRRVGTVR